MSLVVVGLNHRSAPLELLEKVSVSPESTQKVLDALLGCDDVNEAVVLSTCNRTEVYAVAERFHSSISEIRGVIATVAGLHPEDVHDSLYVHADADAVSHLFGVAAGLDSAVLGEVEIVAQLKQSWDLAREAGAARSGLNLAFRRALEMSKRARTETGISRHITSVSQAAVAMAKDRLGPMSGLNTLVLGAGGMGEGMAIALSRSGVTELVIANRTLDNAVELANRVGGTAVELSELNERLASADLLLTSTGATSMMLEHAAVERLIEMRGGRPLLIVDVAVPRDVDPTVGGLDGVTLLDMDDLGQFAEAGLSERKCEIGQVEQILSEELERFVAEQSVAELSPLIGDLYSRAEEIRAGELLRASTRLADLEPRERDAVEALTRGIVAKLLHEPTVQVKRAAGSAKGERLASSLRELFEL
jgi:glutamyl-tRNA reductase